jgi:hypothetical protein
VAPEDAAVCSGIVLQNMQDYGLLETIKDGSYLRVENLKTREDTDTEIIGEDRKEE